MATVKNGAYLKGDTELLPDDLFEAYNKYYDEAEELLSMKECGLSAPEDINAPKTLGPTTFQNGHFVLWRMATTKE